MTSGYETLFTFRVTHGYDEGVFSDVEVVLPEGTLRTLARGRLLSRVVDGVFRVLFVTKTSGEPMFPVSGLRVFLGIRPTDPHFVNYTDLGPSMRSSFRYYGNSGAPGALDAPVARRLVGATLVHDLVISERPLLVSLLDADGDVVATETVSAAMEAKTVSFVLPSEALGRYSVVETFGGSSGAPILYFACAEFLRAGVIAAVEIELADSFQVKDGAPEFSIEYGAKEELLSYYLVSPAATDEELLLWNVADVGYSDEKRLEVQFSSKLDSAFGLETELPVSLLSSAGGRVLLFRSQAPVARRRRARKKIELSRNGEVLIENLPQPGAERADANLIIHISR